MECASGQSSRRHPRPDNVPSQGDRSGTEAPPSPSSSGDGRGQTRLRPRPLVGTHSFNRCDGAPKARAALLPCLKAARLQPTPSPDRSPDPARQPALAPGLSLVPHGCGDPLIRLVQDPRNNRVLEGWEHQLHAAEAAPCVREAGGQGRLSCRARGPVAKVTAGFKGAGVSKEGPRSFVRPLFGRSTAKRSNEGVAGGLRPPASAEGGAAFGRRVGRPSAGRFRCRGRWPLPGGVQGPKAPARVDRLRRSGPAARASGEIVLIHDAHALADQRAGGGVGLFHVHRDHVAALRRRQQRIHVVHVDLGGQQHAEQAAQFHARR
jgi:hypothetical protein